VETQYTPTIIEATQKAKMATKKVLPAVKEMNDLNLARKQIEMQRARIGTLEAKLLKRMSEMQAEIDHWKQQAGVDLDTGF